jgi:carbon storage regulator CsrA
MLVITRREGEEVVIGDPNNPIGVVRIASIKGDRVRVAFDFPRSIDVHRREVAEQIVAGLTQADSAKPASPAAERRVIVEVELNGHCCEAAPAVVAAR